MNAENTEDHTRFNDYFCDKELKKRTPLHLCALDGKFYPINSAAKAVCTVGAGQLDFSRAEEFGKLSDARSQFRME